MFQVIIWTILIVGVLSVIAAWYLLVGLVGIGIAIAAYVVRKKKAEKARLALTKVEDGSLSQEQAIVAMSAGQLQLTKGVELRVVESLRYRENHEWLANRYQVEKAENLEVGGLVLAGTQWIEDLDGRTEKEVLYIVFEDKVLGQLPDVDLADWYDEILEVGGAAKCNLSVTFASDLSVSSIRVKGFNGAL